MVRFQEGYWSFNSIVERMREEAVTLKVNRHNNTCRIRSEDAQVNLENVGLLLVFEKNKVIPAEKNKGIRLLG